MSQVELPSPRELREAAGVTQVRIAADANVSLTSVRVYELDRASLRSDKRAALDAVYARLGRQAA